MSAAEEVSYRANAADRSAVRRALVKASGGLLVTEANVAALVEAEMPPRQVGCYLRALAAGQLAYAVRRPGWTETLWRS